MVILALTETLWTGSSWQ